MRSNNFINETDWNWTPLHACSSAPCLTVRITVADNISEYPLTQTQFDIDSESKITINCGSEGAQNCWIKLTIGQGGQGDPQNIVTVKLHEVYMYSFTSLLLTTSEFSINYIAKLKAVDINYKTKKERWL